MSEVENGLYPQLRLEEFIWSHGNQLSITLMPGLNIIHGKTPFERTTVLRLIRFALGGSAERIDDSIMRVSENVSLSFLANGDSIRSIRNCQVPTGKMQVFMADGRSEISPRDMTELILTELQLPKIYRVDLRQGKQVEVPLTFNDISRAIFVDRDISYPAILNEVMPSSRKQITEVLLGLKTSEIAEIENQVRRLENRRNQIEQEISAIRSFLTHLEVPSILEIQSHRDQLVGELVDLNSQQELLRVQILTDIQYQTNDFEDTYIRFRSELLEKRNQLDAHEQERSDLNHQEREKTDLREVLQAEARRINRHLSSQHVVSTFVFSQCPRCLQPITTEMALREEIDQCMLCGRPLGEDNGAHIAAWEKTLRDADQSIAEVDQLLENYKQRKVEINRVIRDLSRRIRWLEDQLSVKTQQYVSPLIEEIELRAAERTEIEKGLGKLDYHQRQREYAIQMEEEFLPRAERELEELDQTLERLKQALGSTSDRYNAFLAHFRHFLRNIHLVHSFERAEWDEAEQLPLIDGQSYKKAMSGPDLAIIVLAFHYALLAMSVAEPRVKTNHPKLLVIDEPEQQKMGKDRYQEVMRLFGSLALEYKEKVQIVIATESSDIPDAFLEYGVAI